MKGFGLAALAVGAMIGSAQAAVYTIPVGALTLTLNTTIPGNTFAPTDSTAIPPVNYLEQKQGDQFDSSGNLIARSPFGSSSSEQFDAVLMGGNVIFGHPVIGQTSGGGFGTGHGSFTFIWGSPDSYNGLTFLDGGNSIGFNGAFLGKLADGGTTYLATVSGLGNYNAVQFSSTGNSFEFAAVNAVPLPASAPLFGAGLLALGAIGYMKRRKAFAAA